MARSNVIDTADVVNYNNFVSNQMNNPEYNTIINNIRDSLLSIEKKQLELSNYYMARTVKSLSDNIYKLDVNTLKTLVKNNFYDPALMKEILNVMNSIVYLQPNVPGAVNP